MAKKKKNPNRTEAVRRKVRAAVEMSKIGLSLDDDIAIVGFVFSHLSISHLTYLGISSINRFCRTYTGVDICLFSQHTIQPCTPLLCPAFRISDLLRWHHYPLIATSIGTTIEALHSNAPVVYHYAFDPEFVDKSHWESSNFIPAFCDPRVRIIVRHESHKKLIEEEFGIKVCDIVVPDCNVDTLVKFVLTEMKNDN